MQKRCEKICGDDPEHCFINNKRQLDCIADMVTNKIFTIALLLDLAKKEDPKEVIQEYMNQALHASSKLLNWIKYLQVIRDIKILVPLSESNMAELRREERFPLPEGYDQHIRLIIQKGDFSAQGVLLDFSPHGLRFKCSQALDKNFSYLCTLSTTHSVKKSVSFEIIIKHFKEYDNDFVVGAYIGEIRDVLAFDFFESVIEFIRASMPK